MELWQDSHAVIFGSVVRLSWPDGGSTLRQPAITTEMFSLITDEFYKEAEAKSKTDG